MTEPVDYRALAASRKREMEETKDIVLPVVIYGEEAPLPETGKSRNQSGTGTSQGSYTGITRVVKNVRDFEGVTTGRCGSDSFLGCELDSGSCKGRSHCVGDRGNAVTLLHHRQGDGYSRDGFGTECLRHWQRSDSVTVNGSNGILTVHDYE